MNSNTAPEMIVSAKRSLAKAGLHGLLCSLLVNVVTALDLPAQSVESSSLRIVEHPVSVIESQGFARIFVTRDGDLAATAGVEYSTYPLTAKPGLDYAPVAGALLFAPSESVRYIEIPIYDDAVREGEERFRLLLTNATPGVTLISSAADIIISNDDAGFVFGGDPQINEADGEVALSVWNGSDFPGEISVEYLVQSSTATIDSDFTATSGTLTFASGELSKQIRIPILNDSVPEKPETFRVLLKNPSAGSSFGDRRSCIVTIVDNDVGFELECPPENPGCHSVAENGGFAEVDLVIRGDFEVTKEVSVEAVTVSGTAIAGNDFEPLNERIAFSPDERRKRLRIPIVNDSRVNRYRSFDVVLRNADGLLSSATPFQIDVWDDERGYRLPDDITVLETSGEVVIPVYRDGDFDSSSSVKFRVYPADSENTAIPDRDFIPTSGTLTFAPGQTNGSIAVQFLDDSQIEGEKWFYVELLEPSPEVPVWDGFRIARIRDNEVNPLRVDPSFRAAVPYYGRDGINVTPEGRYIVPTSLARLTGESGVGIVRLLDDGTLDPSFRLAKVSGYKTTAVQRDGKVLVAHGPDLFINGVFTPSLARLNADGSLDTEFKPHLGGRTVYAVAVQPDGKILAGGPRWLFRLNSDGSVDSTFQVPAIVGDVTQIKIDQANRILVGGIDVINGQRSIGLARVLPTGILDGSFLGSYRSPDRIYSFEPEPSGSILVRWDRSPDGLLMLSRLQETGEVDFSFTPNLVNCEFFSLIAGGKILAITRDGNDFSTDSALVHRLNADGTPDPSFVTGTFTVSYPAARGWGGDYWTVVDRRGDLIIGGRYPTGDLGASVSVNGHGDPGPVRMELNQPSPRIELQAVAPRVVETNGVVNVKVVRTGSVAKPWNLHWRTTDDGTAQSGREFVTASGDLNFEAGQVEAAIPIELIDDNRLDGDREVRISLAGPDGPLPELTFKIINDDLGFESIHVFPNGRVLLNVTGWTEENFGPVLQRSTNLLDWTEWSGLWSMPELLGKTAVTASQHYFYRLIRASP